MELTDYYNELHKLEKIINETFPIDVTKVTLKPENMILNIVTDTVLLENENDETDTQAVQCNVEIDLIHYNINLTLTELCQLQALPEDAIKELTIMLEYKLVEILNEHSSYFNLVRTLIMRNL
jgi:hypothetical protein